MQKSHWCESTCMTLLSHFCTFESHKTLFTSLSLSVCHSLCLTLSQETQESYGSRSQPAGNAGKPNHDELGLIQQDRPSSLPVSDKSVDQSEHRIKHHITRVKRENWARLFVYFGKAGNSIFFSGENG